jgi:adenylate cyclase class 1
MALEDHDLALLLPMGQPDCIQVFYRVNEDQADLYVLDEFNACGNSACRGTTNKAS